MEKFKNIKKNAYPEILLHDCRINKIICEENELQLVFDRGFIIKTEEGYYYSKTGLIIIEIEDDSDIISHIGSYISTIDKDCFFEIKLKEMMRIINSKKNRCEIIDEYYAECGVFYKIFIKKENDDVEWLTLEIATEQIEYHWDIIDFEKPL